MPWALREDLLPDKEVFSYTDMPDRIFNFAQNWNWNKMFRASFIKKHKIRFQAIHRTNDLLFTCKALVLADKIATVCKPLINYRVGMTTNCQATNCLYPLDFYKAFLELKKWLIRKKLYNKVRKSFTEWALVGCVYNINSIKNHEDIKQLVTKKVFTKGIKELCFENHNECMVEEENYHKEFEQMYEQFRKDEQNRKQEEKQKLSERIRLLFSVRNNGNKTHKVITILGIKIKLKRKCD